MSVLKFTPSALPDSVWEVSDGVASLNLQNIIDDFVLPSVISSEEKDDLVEVAAILINEYVSEDPTIFMDPMGSTRMLFRMLSNLLRYNWKTCSPMTSARRSKMQ